MSKTTRKQLITEKYNELTDKLTNYIDSELFPSLDDIDVVDLVYFFSLTFVGGATDNYENQLKDLLYCRNIECDDDKFKQIYSIVSPYIVWFKSLQ